LTDRSTPRRPTAGKKADAGADGFYRAFEDKHRGSRELIRARLRVYLPFIEPLAILEPHASAVDLGCGRGEWLEVLKEAGFNAHGVDLDDGMLAACREIGLQVEKCDALTFLRQLPDGSQMIVSAFHVVEHLAFPYLRQLVKEALRVLKPAGMLILETPNPENIKVASMNFYLDPTHQRPLPPALLSFLPQYYNFARVKILRLQEPPALLHDSNASLRDVLAGVSPDYAVIAQKAADEAVLTTTGRAFEAEYGLTFDELVERFDRRLGARIEEIAQLTQAVDAARAQSASNSAALAQAAKAWASANAALTKEIALRNGALAAHETQITWLHRRIAEMEASTQEAMATARQQQLATVQLEQQLAMVYRSTSWRFSAPLRLAKRAGTWLVSGTRAWITLKPGSRQRRAARLAISSIEGYIASRPRLRAIITPILALCPPLRIRLQPIAKPQTITAAAPGAIEPGAIDRMRANSEPEAVMRLYRRLEDVRRRVLPNR
jgi:SAM-dependent methyltransferase